VDLFLLPVLAICFAGCGDKFWDPTQVGRFRPVPAVNVILDSLGVAEETPPTWEKAEEPRPADVIAVETDYVLNPGDIVRISIFELLREGEMFQNDYVVSETGKISISEVGTVEAAGLTESQLDEEIKQFLSPSILIEPVVEVVLVNSQQHTFSILGDGVPRPDRYSIPRYDFRLTDALATAGGVSQFNVSYLYISRPVTGKEQILEPDSTRPAEPEEQLKSPQQDMMEMIAPRAQKHRSSAEKSLVITSAEMVTDKDLLDLASPEGFQGQAPSGSRNLTEAQQQQTKPEQTPTESTPQPGKDTTMEPGNRIEWVFQDGKWVPVQLGQPKPEEPTVKSEPEKAGLPEQKREPADFGWAEIGQAGLQRRVIKVAADKLLGGDPRYNIVIKAGDSIYVPVDIIGEFSIMGNVNNQGFINITGRPMTLKMAIAAAGGLGPLAWPKRCEVVRRISRNKEETVMVDLDKIANGEQPDFFIKPNDLINVGTHPTARWRAVLRNAFRATYGFGFIYDRNFADRDYGTSRPIPNWF